MVHTPPLSHHTISTAEKHESALLLCRSSVVFHTPQLSQQVTSRQAVFPVMRSGKVDFMRQKKKRI